MRRSLLRPFLLVTLVLGMAGCSAHMGVLIHDDMAPQDRVDKASVCHKGKTLEVSEAALDAHLRHGDTRGSCH